ncbi:MAG: 4Fe-4S dicluster domain-containing protein [Gammaproteobacteria bacterium]|nr:MAG: 4Fe-4S dicluster domain-containing protein [Gammaproteobacteria bacterium]
MNSEAQGFPADAVETKQADGSTLWEIRTQEQPYAFLSDKQVAETNRYGQKIDLLDLTEGKLPKDRPLYINENPEVGSNPNRNKQHAFFFTADNCIGCHACESACAEKNETPAHLAFRSVGYVEGGSFPDYQRLNISMACNHCDDPVCLKGCPTRAYTKHVEYGAVLQDPDTCFGCGYCTWVCPYNAPQLDPVEGQVSKCNMCVDRLEVNLKPACVSACVGNALDFGVVENIPENREQAKVSIPGFPDPEITHPNIRFQQIRELPEEMKRTDSQPVKYHRSADGNYKPVVDKKQGTKRSWNLKRLSSRENPLVLFTLMSQAAIGAFAIVFLGAQLGIPSLQWFSGQTLYAPLLTLSLGLVGAGLFMSTTHLGKPLRFYRGFNNLRHSPVCREGLGIALFMAFLGLHLLCALPGNDWFASLWQMITGSAVNQGLVEALAVPATVCGYLAILSGAAGLYYMNRCYRIPARPFWNHWQVATSFYGNGLSLGAVVTGLLLLPALLMAQTDLAPGIQLVATLMAGGALVEAIGLWRHNRDLTAAEHEGAASHYVQCTTFGKSYWLRNALLVGSAIAAIALTQLEVGNITSLIALSALALALVVSSLIGRALFYVLVIPTTMPGAFFWRNKGFEQHARDIGLADMPQVGIAPLRH